jgi:hypothetical protein
LTVTFRVRTTAVSSVSYCICYEVLLLPDCYIQSTNQTPSIAVSSVSYSIVLNAIKITFTENPFTIEFHVSGCHADKRSYYEKEKKLIKLDFIGLKRL